MKFHKIPVLKREPGRRELHSWSVFPVLGTSDTHHVVVVRGRGSGAERGTFLLQSTSYLQSAINNEKKNISTEKGL